MSMLVVWPAFSSNALDVIVNDTSKMPLNKKVFGVHGEMLWSPIRYEQKQFVTMYEDLGFNLIRIPGGTTANYYLWREAAFGCRRAVSKKAESRIKSFNNALAKKNRSYSVNDFSSFLAASKATFTYVVNVLCDSPSETSGLMKLFKDKGIEITNVELGNELNYEEHEDIFNTVDDYANASREHALEIRKIFPEALIALVASNTSFRSNDFPDFVKVRKNKRHRRWLQFDKVSANAEFADATTIHLYSPIGIKDLDDLPIKERNETVYRNAMSHFDDRFESSIKYLSELNKNKKIWISEWGIAFWGEQRPYEKIFEKTLYNALYVVNTYLAYFMNPLVSSSNYHNITKLMNDQKKNPTYLAIRLLKDSLRASDQVATVDMRGGLEYKGSLPGYSGKYPELSAAFFFDHNNGEGELIIVNKLATSYMVRSFASNSGKTFSPLEMISLGFNNVSFRAANESDVVVESKIISNKEDVHIRPFSVTRIKAKLVDKVLSDNIVIH